MMHVTADRKRCARVLRPAAPLLAQLKLVLQVLSGQTSSRGLQLLNLRLHLLDPRVLASIVCHLQHDCVCHARVWIGAALMLRAL